MLSWFDRLTMAIAPRWTVKRVRARIAGELLTRHYEAASPGRRTQGWRRTSADANTAIGSAGAMLRDQARDLVRNNAHAESALTTIVDHTVGWGIVAAPKKGSAKKAPSNLARELWKAWAETKACDADGRQDFYGLQAQVMRTVVEAGECLVRRRWRRPEDALPIPMQVQVLEPDFLDTTKTTALPNGGKIIQGIEFDPIGRRAAYWMFPDHPGATLFTSFIGGASQRIPATEILHVFKPGRPGAARAATWFANVILRMKDFDEYDDATLMKQKIAACLAVITSDIDGTSPALGTKDDSSQPGIDSLEPGMIINAAPGRSVTVVDPPTVSDYDPYTRVQLRTIAAGLGVTYEDLTGDYQGMPFSAARMSRMRHWARVHAWRWRMLIPQFCDPVWGWAMDAAGVMGLAEKPTAEWTAPPMPILDPVQESTAYQRLVRVGALSWPEMIRERGYDPEAVLAEIAEWNAKFDALGVILDSDPRRTSQQGQAVESIAPAAEPATTNGNGNGANA